MAARDPLSPCVKICSFNPYTGLCDGCLRTMEEIGGWSTYTVDRKLAVRAELETRRAELEARARTAGEE